MGRSFELAELNAAPTDRAPVARRPAGDRKLKGFDDPVAVWSTT
jgi:hypothetical protein